MRYQGGKSRIAGAIVAKIRELHPTATEIWEPFCGGGAVTLALAKAGFRVHASDNHEDLILMWQALMRGETEPFADVTREEHTALKYAPSSARRGLVPVLVVILWAVLVLTARTAMGINPGKRRNDRSSNYKGNMLILHARIIH
mgnify:CR=1 FL=1